MATTDNIDRSDKKEAPSEQSQAAAESARREEAALLASTKDQIYNSIAALIDAANLTEDVKSALKTQLRSDLGGMTTRPNQAQIDAIKSEIKAAISQEVQEHEAENRNGLLHVMDAAKEASSHAVSKIGGAIHTALKSFIPKEKHREIDEDEIKIPRFLKRLPAHDDDDKDTSFQGKIHHAKVAVIAMANTVVSRGKDTATSIANVAQSGVTAVGGVSNYVWGAMTGDDKLQQEGYVTIKTGFDRRAERAYNTLSTAGETALDIVKGVATFDGTKISNSLSRFGAGLSRQLGGDHTDQEIDKLLPALEKLNWGKLKDSKGNYIFGIGNGHLDTKHIRAALERYGIQIKQDEGEITVAQITALMNKAVQAEKQIAAKTKDAALTPMEKAIQQARAQVDRDGDHVLSQKEMDAALDKVGKIFKAAAGKDGKMTNAELAEALGTIAPANTSAKTPNQGRRAPAHS